MYVSILLHPEERRIEADKLQVAAPAESVMATRMGPFPAKT